MSRERRKLCRRSEKGKSFPRTTDRMSGMGRSWAAGWGGNVDLGSKSWPDAVQDCIIHNNNQRRRDDRAK